MEFIEDLVFRTGQIESCLYDCVNKPEENGKLMGHEKGRRDPCIKDDEAGVGTSFSLPLSQIALLWFLHVR